jgi:nitronate monooxygenase
MQTVQWRTRLTAAMTHVPPPSIEATTTTTTTTTTATNSSTCSSPLSDTTRIPIMSAPMAGHAGGKLAAAVTHAGGIGMIGAGHWLSDAMNPRISTSTTTATTSANTTNSKTGLELLHDEITLFQEHNTRVASHMKFPLCIGFIGHSTFANVVTTTSTTNQEQQQDCGGVGGGGGWERLEYVVKKYQPSIIQLFAPAISYRKKSLHEPNKDVVVMESIVHWVHQCSNNTTKVFVQVGTVAEAVEAMENNVDGIIVQGSEAGGHGVCRELGSGTLSLVATVIHRIRGPYNAHTTHPSNTTTSLPTLTQQRTWEHIPILAAGGIVDGTTMAAAMALGCDGVVIGTRFLASSESLGLPSLKAKLVTTESCDDIVRTTIFDSIQNSYSKTPWPKPYDSVGAIKNDTYHQWASRSCDELASALLMDNNEVVVPYQKACAEGNADVALIHAGEGIGQIHSIESAYNLVHTISNDAISVIQKLPQSILYSGE